MFVKAFELHGNDNNINKYKTIQVLNKNQLHLHVYNYWRFIITIFKYNEMPRDNDY